MPDLTSLRRTDSSIGVVRRIGTRYLKGQFGLISLGIAANVVVAGATGALPWVVQLSMDHIFVARNERMLLILPLVAVGVMLVKGGGSYVAQITMNRTGLRFVARIQEELFASLMWSDLSLVSGTHSGRFISTFMTDAPRLQSTMTVTIVNLARNALTVVGLYGAMFYMDWRMALLMTAALPVVLYTMSRQGRRVHGASSRGLEEIGGLSAIISDALGGFRVVKAYGREEHEIIRARESIARVFKQMYRGLKARAITGPVTEAATGFAIGGIILYGGWRHLYETLTVGEFTGFLAAVMLVYQPLKSVANQQTALQEGLAAARRLFAVLDVVPDVRDHAGSRELKVERGEVSFESVTFGYAGGGGPVLEGITLSACGGGTTALVGPSGGGKSTLLNMVPRFFDPESGRVAIDGHDLREMTLGSVRAASAIVTQEPILFDETVRANIAYGRPTAGVSEIEDAARGAAAHDFIKALPEGYETRIGESGLRLSGGERQRIAIARAMLKDAPILLLDEPTSALDTASEEQVRDALTRLMTGRTTLVIAHRLSTIVHADLICVIDAGRVVESGTHEELLARKGLYASLFGTQFATDRADRRVGA